MKKILLCLALSSCAWSCDHQKIYVDEPCEVFIIDDLDIITTQHRIIMVQRVSKDDDGIYYYDDEVLNITDRRGESTTPLPKGRGLRREISKGG